MMKISKVASTLLDAPQMRYEKQNHHVYNSSKDRKPIITPFISANGNSEHGQQYLLIPNIDHILVASLEHGQHVCKLVATEESNTKVPTLNSAEVLKITKGDMSREENIDENSMEIEGISSEYIVVGGFSDGSLHEWSLSSIPYTKYAGKTKSRRVFKFGMNGSVSHITSPSGHGNDFVYALVTSKVDQKKESKFVSFNIPVCNELRDDITLEAKHVATFTNRKDAKNRTLGDNADENISKIQEFITVSMPFAFLSAKADRSNAKEDSFIAICHKKGFFIYHEEKSAFVSIPKTQSGSEICAAAISPNGEDIALGYCNGKIDILTSVLSQAADYLQLDGNTAEERHPRENLVARTIHWHSLPVKTLCYLGTPGSRATPSLLSGGEEAVLVTWSIDRGLNRPAHTLPRIAKGCITHIATNSHPDSSSNGNLDIIVKCMDDTIQLVQGHNHATRWKVQGLACALNECVAPVQPTSKGKSQLLPSAIVTVDPKSQIPIITRMAGAPGFVHWFDPKSSQVIGELEVAAYNRISRKEAHHKAYPRPTVTHMVLSNSGNDMITIDTMLSENTGVGNYCKVKSFTISGEDLSEEMSSVTNIKFWSWSREMEKNAKERGKGMPYELIAAMPAPHGLTGGCVDALAISPDGSKACSLSYDEGAFHIWAKGRTSAINSGSSALTPYVPSWKRLCKIAIPSGYSNACESRSGQSSKVIAFSPDGSVLTIAFGRHVTLWDHTNATMLNTISAPEPLRDISFVRSPVDMILAIGESSVSILPPFGKGYLGNNAWSYKLPYNTGHDERVRLGLVTPLLGRKELAIALTRRSNNDIISTRIVIVDLISGKAKKSKDGSSISWETESGLQNLTDISHLKNEWSSTDDTSTLLVVTDKSEMLVLEADGDNSQSKYRNNLLRGCFSKIEDANTLALSSKTAPKLENMKRKRIETDEKIENKRNALNPMVGALLFDQNSMDSGVGPVPTSQLPALSGSFARSFIARNVKKAS